MVKRLHAAGLEVILDVVFNHTAEADHQGPTLCHRGLDNPAYYRLDPNDRRHYVDTTGCGNSLNVGHSTTLRLIMDSLRYWVEEMHVDGFRFDLATALGRDDGSFAQTRFLLRPRDPGPGRQPRPSSSPSRGTSARWTPTTSAASLRCGASGTASSATPSATSGAGTDGRLGELATRLAGSADLFGGSTRRPSASINLITVHDGFTLRDLVSYDGKHNEANGEQNRDGTDDNRSWNSGVEGPTDQAAINDLRALRSRALLTTLLTSLGAPLLLAGDELGRTQGGNNNAYSQDNAIAWVDWESVDDDLHEFTRRVIALRREHPVLRRRRFLTGAQTEEIGWYSPSGAPMTGADWADPGARCVAMYLDGSDAPDRDDQGAPLVDDDLLLLVNGWSDTVDFAPATSSVRASPWSVTLDSSTPDGCRRPPPELRRGRSCLDGHRPACSDDSARRCRSDPILDSLDPLLRYSRPAVARAPREPPSCRLMRDRRPRLDV